MAALLWLADELRAADLTVVEYSGWKTHTRDGSWNPTYGVVHATAAPRTQKDSVQVDVVRNGRADLPGPIANAVVRRDGVWVVVSAGRCNSTLAGTDGPFEGLGNTNALSVEGCNDNLSEPWPQVQYRSYVRGWAAWCRRLAWPASRLVGHKEHTPGRKSDPTFSMDQFRRDVAAVLAGEDDDMTPQDLMAHKVRSDSLGGEFLVSSLLIQGLAAVRHLIGGQIASDGTVTPGLLSQMMGARAELAALRGVVDVLAATVQAGGGNVDTAAVLAGVDQRVSEAVEAIRSETRDAVADLGEGGAARVRADAATD